MDLRKRGVGFIRSGARAVLAAVVLAAVAAGCGVKERDFSGPGAFRLLEEQVAFGPRIPGTEGHAAALQFFRDYLGARADQVSLHSFEMVSPLDSGAATAHNVIAVFNPESPTRLCLGAHWDSRPVADQDPDESLRAEPVPGANDGASGVAVLLEVADNLAEVPPTIGVDIVLFDAEDSGVDGDPRTFALGSQRFVRDHPTYRPSLMLLLDMVGRPGMRIAREANSVLGAPRQVEVIWALGRELGLTVLADTLGQAMFDDHIPFLEARIPAVDLIDTDDPRWHTTQDLPEYCAPESLEEIGRLVLALIRRTEQAQRP